MYKSISQGQDCLTHFGYLIFSSVRDLKPGDVIDCLRTSRENPDRYKATVLGTATIEEDKEHFKFLGVEYKPYRENRKLYKATLE